MKMSYPTVLAIIVGCLLLSCEKQNTEVDLMAYYWNVTQVKKSTDPAPRLANGNYIVRFYQDKTYSLQLDVNSCGGTYNIDAPMKLRLSPLACTNMCCDSDIGNVIAEVLPSVSSYSFNGSRLTLKGNGSLILKGTKL